MHGCKMGSDLKIGVDSYAGSLSFDMIAMWMVMCIVHSKLDSNVDSSLDSYVGIEMWIATYNYRIDIASG